MSAAIAAMGLQGLHQISDADLLLAASHQDQSAFAQLVERYYGIVHRVVWRTTNGHADAEDIAQEAFLRLWKNPGQVREAKALKGWLMRVASNLAMDRFRNKPLAELDAAAEVSDGRPNAEQNLARNWATKRVDAAIAELAERQRLALSLVHFEQLSNIEAADIMEISVDALESLLSRARRALKQHLAADKILLLATLNNEDT